GSAMKRLLLLALAPASLLVVFASALPAAARQYDGQASARMSCTVNTVTMTRTVLVTIKWKNVNEGGGVAEAEGLAIESSPADPLAWDSTEISPPEGTGTVSFTLAFNDTTPFGNVQWQLYNPAHIAPVKAGLLDASTVAGCPYP
ncbi:MAG TPA: hypothetical protein VGS80_12045, partial [Ktedonobacterales bacterium]|nr:hypothetical protein [Ktedonobacterales bacterium]